VNTCANTTPGPACPDSACSGAPGGDGVADNTVWPSASRADTASDGWRTRPTKAHQLWLAVWQRADWPGLWDGSGDWDSRRQDLGKGTRLEVK